MLVSCLWRVFMLQALQTGVNGQGAAFMLQALQTGYYFPACEGLCCKRCRQVITFLPVKGQAAALCYKRCRQVITFLPVNGQAAAFCYKRCRQAITFLPGVNFLFPHSCYVFFLSMIIRSSRAICGAPFLLCACVCVCVCVFVCLFVCLFVCVCGKIEKLFSRLQTHNPFQDFACFRSAFACLCQ